jgi:hypothetical protein
MATISDILEAIDKAMGVVKTIADTPGVNLIPYVSTLSGVIGTVHAAYTAGKNIEPYIQAISDTFTKPGMPTEADMAALDAKIADLEAQIQAPLPPKEDGEED